MAEHTTSGESKIEPEIVLRQVAGRGKGAGGGRAGAGGGGGKTTQLKPTMSEIRTSQDNVARELTPSELFEKVALDDAKQNKRLTSNGSPSLAHKDQRQPFKTVGDSSPREAGAAQPGTRMRFIICTLGLMSLAMSQMSRMVLNQSITQMVDPSMLTQKQDSHVPSDGSCPWPDDEKKINPSLELDDNLPHLSYEIPTTTTQSQPLETPLVDTTREGTENFNELPDFLEHELTTLRPVVAGDNQGPTRAPTNEQLVEGITHVFEITNDELDNVANKGDVNESDGGQNQLGNVNVNGNGHEPQATTTLLPNEPTLPIYDTQKHHASQQQQQQQNLLLAYPKYKWTIKEQNILLGGFYYSYFIFMILGGRMAEIYGAKYVLLLSVGGSALINLATPWMANTSFVLLVMSRVVMGAIQSGVFPGMYALIAKWLTMTEASIYAPLIKMNLRLGMVLGSLLPGLTDGWPSVFYLTGVLSAIWSLVWLAIASSEPADNRWVSPGELKHINRKKTTTEPIKLLHEPSSQANEIEMDTRQPAAASQVSQVSTNQAIRRPTPWIKLLTAPSVVGLILVKLTFNYALDFLIIELPSYLSYVHHANEGTRSAITGTMFGVQVVLIVFVGWLAKIGVQRRPFGLDKTGIRKLFQGLASFGLAATFLLLTFNNCNLTYVTILLQLISLLSMFAAGGETMLPYDLSLEYPATIMAIANSVANLSGVATTTLTGLVLGTQGGSYYRWNILIYLIAGANLLGGLAFTLLVRAEPIDFNTKINTNKRQSEVQGAGVVTSGDIEAAPATAATAAAAAKVTNEKEIK